MKGAEGNQYLAGLVSMTVNMPSFIALTGMIVNMPSFIAVKGLGKAIKISNNFKGNN